MLPNLMHDQDKLKKYSLSEKQNVFLDNYMDVLKNYIAGGNPSEDTLKNYVSRIQDFLEWCHNNKIYPMHVHEQHVILYRSYLIDQKQKAGTINNKLTAIRKFYHIAQKFALIASNPVEDIKAPRDPDADSVSLQYLTAGQIEYILRSITVEDEKTLRDLVIIFLMALEGLRTVEIYRMSIEHIDQEKKAIKVIGKGHNDYIYPREDTFGLLIKYLRTKETYPIADAIGVPVFTSTSNNKTGCRISRRNIRTAVDGILAAAGVKMPGKSCHVLRHSCATMLYAETKDLKVVQETLRHKSTQMASRYAHLQNRMENRYTKNIPIQIDNILDIENNPKEKDN